MKPSPFTRPSKKLNSDMNVVPYIDVMLVLLVIFMVTTPMLTTGVDVDLPKQKTNNITTSTQLPVIVSMTETGELFVSYEDKQDIPTTEDELIQTLTELQADKPNTEGDALQVMINADKSNQYGAVMAVMANLQQAGIEKVGLLTSPSDKKADKKSGKKSGKKKKAK